jgi:hypothetical protein
LLFIFSTSYDTTADLLIHTLGPDRVFRYNFDLWRDYRIEVGPEGFRIEDPVGRVLRERDVTKAFWQKPARTRDIFPETPIADEDRYREEELWYVLKEIFNLLWDRQRVVLVEPYVDIRVGKFVQTRLAARYFRVPEYRFTCGQPAGRDGAGPQVAKSLTSEPVVRGEGRVVLYSTLVDPRDLSPGEPWLTQDYVAAGRDVTVVFVRDRAFAFELDRAAFLDRTIDWREMAVEETSDRWLPHRLPADVESGIFRFMEGLGLHYGRLDFLVDDSGYWFLEVNPSGLWAWLDATGEHGLLGKMAEEISPFTPCRPIPVGRHISASATA